mgnify:CR=1 FL=1
MVGRHKGGVATTHNYYERKILRMSSILPRQMGQQPVCSFTRSPQSIHVAECLWICVRSRDD